MPAKSPTTYINLLQHYNRTVPKIETCECGKLTSNMESHLKTGTHAILMYYKAQYEEMTKQKANQPCHQEEKKKPKKPSKWAQIVHAT